MYPHERSLVTEMQGKPFVLIGVNSDSVEDARKAVEANDLNWRSFQDAPAGRARDISDEWMVRAWPTLVVLDAGFRIRYRGHDGDEAIRIARALVAAREGAED